MAARQPVHVGETVEFDLVLTDGFGKFTAPSGSDQYAVLYVGFDRSETEPDEVGHFRFSHRFEKVADGASIGASAAIFQQRGNRDFIHVQGEWLQSISPYEESDRFVAGDRITFDVYQARVSLTIARPPFDLDLDSGVMRFHRADGTTSSVYRDRRGRPGFTIAGPEPNGYYSVTYEPSGDQLNPTGTTRVTFTIHDVGGQRHTDSVELDTP